MIDRRRLVGAGLGLLAWAPTRGFAADGGWPVVEGREEGRIRLRDDLGEALSLEAPVTRVAVFNRYTAELVRAVAGAGAIAGIDVEAARDPAYWPNLHAVRIGQGQSAPNYEALIGLRPDAVLFPRNGEWRKARDVLAPFAIPVIVLTGWDVLKHEANVALLGVLFDRRQRADDLNAFHRRIRDMLATRTAGLARKRVYFEEVGAYKTVLRGSGWHDMIEAAGGTNIFGDVGGLFQPAARGTIQGFDVDPEEILVRRPDVIVKLQPGQYEPHTARFSADVLETLKARPGFDGVPAVCTHHVYHMSYYLAGACSKIVGALQLAKWLHPAVFADIDPGEAMRTWLETFQGVPYPGGYWAVLAAGRP